MIAQQGTLCLSRARLVHNLEMIRARIGAGSQVCATIKANAYGHGVGEIAQVLRGEDVKWVCVYSLEEAAAVARFEWDGILVLAPLVLLDESGSGERFLASIDPKIRVNITDAATTGRFARMLDAIHVRVPVRVHIQVDTGLTRAGIDPANVDALIREIRSFPQLELEGIFAHLSHGDAPGHVTVADQMEALQRIAGPLKKQQPHLLVHLQNSGASWSLQGAAFDMVRVGIALYGLQPSTEHPIAGLLPIARLTAPILAIHNRGEQVGVGYGHTFVTGRESRIAIVPVGYADGYPRSLSNRAIVQVLGVDAPVVGRVSMDQIIVDVTDVPRVAVGDEVTVISDDPGKANSVDRLADAMQTIGYELTTRWGSRLRRVVVD